MTRIGWLTVSSQRSKPVMGKFQRVLLSSVIFHIAMVIGIVVILEWRQRQVMIEHVKTRAWAIGLNFAYLNKPALVSYNYAAMDRASEILLRDEPDVRYAVIHLRDGRVGSLNGREQMYGSLLEDEVSQEALRTEKPLMQTITPHGTRGAGYDIAVPIYLDGSAKKWGTTRVGFSLQRTQQQFAQTQRDIILMSLAFIVGAIWLTSRLMRILRHTHVRATGLRVPVRMGQLIQNAHEAVETARAFMGHSEWMVALCLSETHRLLGIHVFYQNAECPHGPVIEVEPLRVFMAEIQADQMMTVRYHPHQMPALTATRAYNFRVLGLSLKAAGLPSRQHLTVDVTGAIFAWDQMAFLEAPGSGRPAHPQMRPLPAPRQRHPAPPVTPPQPQ